MYVLNYELSIQKFNKVMVLLIKQTFCFHFKSGESQRRVRVEELLIRYNVYYLVNGYTKNPIPTTTKYTHVTNMHM